MGCPFKVLSLWTGKRRPHKLPDAGRHSLLALARQVDCIKCRFFRSQHGQEDSPGDQQHVVLPREATLSQTEPVIERRQRQFEHHHLTAWRADLAEQLIEVLFKLIDCCRTEDIVASDFEEHDWPETMW